MKKKTDDSWDFDDVLVEFFNAAKARRSSLSKSTRTLFRKNKTPFLKELDRQAVRRAYSGAVELSEHDYDLGILYNVVRREVDKKRNNSAREILAPAVRALMTDEDPEGRKYLATVNDVGLLCQMLVLFMRADFIDGIWAFLGMLLLSHWDTLDADFDDNDWRVIGSAAGRLGKNVLAASAFLRAAKLDREPERRNETYFDASRGILFRLRDKPSDTGECLYMAKILAECRDNLEDVPQFRVLCGLLDVWTAKLRGGDIPEATGGLIEAAKRTADEWDANLDKADSSLDASELAVKAPLEWQSYIACLDGAVERQIASFPTPLYADGEERGLLPAASHVNGLRIWDVWEGLLPRLPDKFDDTFAELGKGSEIRLRSIPSGPIQQTGPLLVADYQLAQSSNRANCDISVLSVSARPAGRRKSRPEMAFPFPAKDNEANAANTSGRPWEYFVWRHGVAADVRVELKSGQHLVASMPFFTNDVHALVRGLSYNLYLAAFPLTFKRISCPHDAGKITQKCGDFRFTRAGADIVARVTSVTTATLWNGESVYKFMLHVGGLGFELPAFVGRNAIEGAEFGDEAIPIDGDMVESRAWLMADFRDDDEDRAAFLEENPKGVVVKPMPVEVPDEKEDGTFLLECHVAGTSRVDDFAGKTAELQKDSPLYLRREPGNEYDRDAIAIYTAEENRIGYVPQKHNPILSRLLDGGRDLIGKVVSREVVDDSVRMKICIYMR